jgi:HEAT repeat protein
LLAIAANKGPDAVRLAAVQNVTHLAYAPAVPLLVELSLAGDTDLATAARTCLASFPGSSADATILALLGHKDAKVRGMAVEMITQRHVDGLTARLLKTAEDADEIVRLAALKALRHEADVAELPALLQILLKARSPVESQAAESAVGALCARQVRPVAGNVVVVKAEYGDLRSGLTADVTKKAAALVKDGVLAIEASNENFGDPASRHVKRLRVDYRINGASGSKTVREGETLTFTATATPPEIVDAICVHMPAARGEAKLALLRTLRTTGGAKALQTVRAAMADSDSQVKETALVALCEWPTPDAIPAISELLKTPPTKTAKILALRGFVRLVPDEDAPDAMKFEALKDAMAQADRNEDKQLVLSALGNVATAEALALVASHLDNPVLKEEACLAAVAIAEKLTPGQRAAATTVMKQVAKTTSNKKLAARANAITRATKGPKK